MVPQKPFWERLMPDGSSGELQDLKIEAQPASLFVLPADYRKQYLPH